MSCEEHPVTGQKNPPPWNGEIVNINARAQLNVAVVKPTCFDNVVEITRLVKQNLTVILNLEQIDADCALRIVDFVAGVAYARNGIMKRITQGICLVAPYDVVNPLLNSGDARFEDIAELLEKCGSGLQTAQTSQTESGRDGAQDIHSYIRSHQETESFTEYMLRVIRERGLRESDVYNGVHMDRKLFNKIRNDPDYQPSKRTALLIAIALRLNLSETQEFLGKAGYVMSHSNMTDLIVEYFIITGNYDVMEINEMLHEFNLPLLLKGE